MQSRPKQPPIVESNQLEKYLAKTPSSSSLERISEEQRKDLARDALNNKYQKIEMLHLTASSSQKMAYFLDSLTDNELASLNELLSPQNRQEILKIQEESIKKGTKSQIQQYHELKALHQELNAILTSHDTIQVEQELQAIAQQQTEQGQQSVYPMTFQQFETLFPLRTLDPSLPYFAQLFIFREKHLFLWKVDSLNTKYNFCLTFFGNLALAKLGRKLITYNTPAWAYNSPRLLTVYLRVINILASVVNPFKILSLAFVLHFCLWKLSHQQVSTSHRVNLSNLFDVDQSHKTLYQNKAYRKLLGRIASKYPDLVNSQKVIKQKSKEVDLGISMSEVDLGAQELEEALTKIQKYQNTKNPIFNQEKELISDSQSIKYMKDMTLFYRYLFGYQGGNSYLVYSFGSLLLHLDKMYHEETKEIQQRELEIANKFQQHQFKAPSLVKQEGNLSSEQEMMAQRESELQKLQHEVQKENQEILSQYYNTELKLQRLKKIKGLSEYKKIPVPQYYKIRQEFNSFDFQRKNIGILVGPTVLTLTVLLRRFIKF